jgi:hypothetical protein
MQATEPNPFHQRASQRLLEHGRKGGQHASSQADRLSGDDESLIDFERERAELAFVEGVPF